MWEYYLVLCEIGFRRRTNVVFQMQLTRRLDVLPMTRDYIGRLEESSVSQWSPTSVC
jgi:cyclopropane-fatty-acyl-phospholipid synthase